MIKKQTRRSNQGESTPLNLSTYKKILKQRNALLKDIHLKLSFNIKIQLKNKIYILT